MPLVSNQINCNLMRHRSSMETKAVCDELGIQVFGYHPLGSGVLTRAYDKEWFSNVPPGLNQRRSKSTRVHWYQKNCAPVITAVRDVADRRGKSAAHVAINWCVCKGPWLTCRALGANAAVRGGPPLPPSLGCARWLHAVAAHGLLEVCPSSCPRALRALLGRGAPSSSWSRPRGGVL